MDDYLLDVLLNGVTEPRLKLTGGDSPSSPAMVLPGLLADAEQPEEIRQAAVELRFHIGSRLAVPL
ncbi:hypothetical protein ACE1OC_40805 [Streptomyces sp. DSM 116496]|uniref:hypothetical protein n=1 Tax=Streptomyces stoeckheimensis TaxID=3344656 RepID=UPI0038B29C28